MCVIIIYVHHEMCVSLYVCVIMCVSLYVCIITCAHTITCASHSVHEAARRLVHGTHLHGSVEHQKHDNPGGGTHVAFFKFPLPPNLHDMSAYLCLLCFFGTFLQVYAVLSLFLQPSLEPFLAYHGTELRAPAHRLFFFRMKLEHLSQRCICRTYVYGMMNYWYTYMTYTTRLIEEIMCVCAHEASNLSTYICPQKHFSTHIQNHDLSVMKRDF